MSTENPYDKERPFALDNLVPKEVARATIIVQAITENEFGLKIYLDHTGSTGIVGVEDTDFDVLEILEAIHTVIPETISVTFDAPANAFLISQLPASLN